MEVLQCQFSSDTIVAAAQLVNRGLLNSSTAFSNEKKRKKYRQHSFNFCVRVTALCLAQSVYSQCTQKCTLCTQNVLSVFPIPLLFNALITVLTNYSLLISCDHLMSEPELRVLYASRCHRDQLTPRNPPKTALEQLKMAHFTPFHVRLLRCPPGCP